MKLLRHYSDEEHKSLALWSDSKIWISHIFCKILNWTITWMQQGMRFMYWGDR